MWVLIPESGRSPGVGDGNWLQYSCLENSMDRGIWWVTVPGSTASWHYWASKHTEAPTVAEIESHTTLLFLLSFSARIEPLRNSLLGISLSKASHHCKNKTTSYLTSLQS